MKDIYLIKDLSNISGQSIHTIKYYLKIGLIKEFARSPDTRYRYFNDNVVSKLSLIRGMRKRGMSIREIKAEFGT
ncbi:MAG: hypothetical protein AUJ75_04545 [Candidatus Omnitrophica bacterium CG1_02_49_10]|nr:MAG: hypothetical protein AUJ75_04545 [Candidatus Omnitrophica bacterium CG1_02_49_10]